MFNLFCIFAANIINYRYEETYIIRFSDGLCRNGKG